MVTRTEMSFEVYYNIAEEVSGGSNIYREMGQCTQMSNILRSQLTSVSFEIRFKWNSEWEKNLNKTR